MLIVCTRDRQIVLPDPEITEPQAASHGRPIGYTWWDVPFCWAVNQLFAVHVMVDQELHPPQLFI
jgi:hypothetical protein